MSELTGYLVTRHWRDTPDGIELVFWACSPEGPLRLSFSGQQAVCFVDRGQSTEGVLPGNSDFTRRPLALENLQGAPVDGLYFRQQRQLLRFRDRAREAGIVLMETDIKPSNRFLMERFITATFRASGEVSQRNNYLEMTAPRLESSDFKPAFAYLSLDIETDVIGGEVLSIAFCGQGHEEVLMQGSADNWPSDLPIRWFADERRLLEGFLQRIADLDPDLLLGWNLINFDLDYLARRCRRYRIPFLLGRGGESAAILQPQQDGQQCIASIPGRVALDGIDNLRSAFFSFESFELGQVARQLLGRGKLIEGSEGKVEEILRQFREDRPALATYNLEDCRLVEEIFQHTDLIAFAAQRAVMTGLPLGRQGGSVAAFDNLYLPRMHRAGVVAHDIGAFHYNTSSPGGYVMDSQPGLYDNVLVLDFKSLYPSIIRTFRIDPLGLAHPGTDPIPGFLDACFSREISILPGIIDDLWKQREQAKRHHDAPLSQATKIIMNSFYGVLGSSGCRFHNPKLASSITRRGHQVINHSRNWLEERGFQVIYGDTDSLFVLLGPEYPEEEANKTGQRLARELTLWWQAHIRQEFRLDSYLELEFETHFIRFLMPTIRGLEKGSKKRYAGYIRDSQGDFQIVFKGLESVRSDWTPLAREFQRELYRRVFFNEPYRDFIRETVTALKAGRLDWKLVYRKRLRRPLDAYQRNVPPHVQAARKQKTAGRRIDYLITLNGPEPTSEHTTPIDYQHYIDRQLAPAADGILHFLNDSFEAIVSDQMALF